MCEHEHGSVPVAFHFSYVICNMQGRTWRNDGKEVCVGWRRRGCWLIPTRLLAHSRTRCLTLPTSSDTEKNWGPCHCHGDFLMQARTCCKSTQTQEPHLNAALVLKHHFFKRLRAVKDIWYIGSEALAVWSSEVSALSHFTSGAFANMATILICTLFRGPATLQQSPPGFSHF